MDRLGLVAQIERAFANANDSASALVKFAESLQGEDKYTVEQIVWAIQDELETLSICVKQYGELEPSSGLNQAEVVQLVSQESRNKPGCD